MGREHTVQYSSTGAAPMRKVSTRGDRQVRSPCISRLAQPPTTTTTTATPSAPSILPLRIVSPCTNGQPHRHHIQWLHLALYTHASTAQRARHPQRHARSPECRTTISRCPAELKLQLAILGSCLSLHVGLFNVRITPSKATNAIALAGKARRKHGTNPRQYPRNPLSLYIAAAASRQRGNLRL